MKSVRLFTICLSICLISILGIIFVWSKNIETKKELKDKKIELQNLIDEVVKLELKKTEELLPPVEVIEPINEAPPTEEPAEEIVILPQQVELVVPFTSQAPEKNWEQPWQDACEEAAVLMLDAYYKNYSLSPLFAKDELQKMVDWETKQGWDGSIEIKKVKMLTEWYVGNEKLGMQDAELKIIENPTIDDIKRSLFKKHPVLVVADGKVLPNPNFRNGGPVYHALIVVGYNDTTQEFITNDPGTQFGEGFKYKYEDLMNSIHDWNYGNVANGKKTVLIFE